MRAGLLTLAGLTLMVPAASGQRLSAWGEASLAHAQPPAWAESRSPELFGVAVARLRVDAARGWLDVAAQAGRGDAAGPGTWLGGEIAVEWPAAAGRVSVRPRAEAFGLRYAQAHGYATYGITLRPALLAEMRGFHFTLAGELTRGEWRMTVVEEAGPNLPILPRPPIPGREFTETGELRRTGLALDVERRVGPLWLRLGGERYDAVSPVAAGVYEGGSAGVAFAVGPVQIGIGGQLWDRPGGRDYGYYTAVTVPMGDAASAFANFGSTVTDPLYGTPPARAAGAGLRFRLGGGPARPLPVAELGARTASGRAVRFRLQAPRASSVAVAGTFSAWEAVPMRRDRDAWIVELVLEPGLHHFAFVVDGGDWMVPDDAPGIVLDGWGRRNASIVIVADAAHGDGRTERGP